jgi:REP element-mobilizing transposase RayT
MIMTFTRRNLPHLYLENGRYFITFRLADSIPYKLLRQIIKNHHNIKDDDVKSKRIFQKYDDILDSGKYGANYLKLDEIAELVKTCIHYPDGAEYTLICYTIMSNHAHVVFDLLENNKGVSKIMQSIKGISARRSNNALNRSGTFWQDESFDRLIRNDRELLRIINYVLNNPVKAGLVTKWNDWKHSYCHPDFIDLIS